MVQRIIIEGGLLTEINPIPFVHFFEFAIKSVNSLIHLSSLKNRRANHQVHISLSLGVGFLVLVAASNTVHLIEVIDEQLLLSGGLRTSLAYQFLNMINRSEFLQLLILLLSHLIGWARIPLSFLDLPSSRRLARALLPKEGKSHSSTSRIN